MINNLLKRSEVEKSNNYSDYKQELRKDFFYSCGYCSTSEAEFHGNFEIDHYLPQKKHPELKNDYNNLIWSCFECNRAKGDFDSSNNQYKIFRPDEYCADDHFELENDVLKGKTHEIGETTINILRLNSKRLRTLRTIRREENKLEQEIAFGIFYLDQQLRKGNSINKAQIITRINALKAIQSSLEDFMRQYALETCSSYEHDEDPNKEELQRKKRTFLNSIKS